MPDRAVLTFHSIDSSESVLSVTPVMLRRRIESLLRQQAVIRLLEEVRKEPADESGRPVVAITFDDGFSNFASEARPILEEYALPATVFLVAAYVGKTNDWPSQPSGFGGRELLSWSEIEELSRAGVSFGAHTLTHPDLARVSIEAARAEIVESKQRIEDRTGRAVTSFAYPYGSESSELRMIVAEHFAVGCSTRLGYVGQASPRESLERVDAYYLRGRLCEGPLFSAYARGYLAWRSRLRKWNRRLASPN